MPLRHSRYICSNRHARHVVRSTQPCVCSAIFRSDGVFLQHQTRRHVCFNAWRSRTFTHQVHVLSACDNIHILKVRSLCLDGKLLPGRGDLQCRQWTSLTYDITTHTTYKQTIPAFESAGKAVGLTIRKFSFVNFLSCSHSGCQVPYRQCWARPAASIPCYTHLHKRDTVAGIAANKSHDMP